jgi:predicted lipid carrier protein YhbT/chorismate mutase
MPTEPAALARTRVLIDAVDAGLLLMLAVRRQLAHGAARSKRAAGLPLADGMREARVRRRALRMAARVGLPDETACALVELAIADARRSQGLPVGGRPDLDQCPPEMPRRIISIDMDANDRAPAPHARWLRLLPPPARWAPLLRALPSTLRQRALERALGRALAGPLQAGALEFLRGRHLGIEVTDLGLRWVLSFDGSALHVVDERVDGHAAEACVRGSATDLLLLAGRLEDADTLFFQRRLEVTGDTELGLTARNLLDRLPWESIPLALRIGMNRGARLARAARAANAAS